MRISKHHLKMTRAVEYLYHQEHSHLLLLEECPHLLVYSAQNLLDAVQGRVKLHQWEVLCLFDPKVKYSTGL